MISSVKAFALITALAFVVLPQTGFSQCSCEGGVQPNELSHIVALSPTTSSTTTINFPKFDPSIGTLNCVKLEDTVSIESTLGLRNKAPDPIEYTFRFTLTSSVSGPSLSRSNFRDKEYGPDLLGPYGTPEDSTTKGPDTLYNKVASSRTNSADMVPYLGNSGTVPFTYTIGGGVASLAGGINYAFDIKSSTWGVFKLTYLWCEQNVLGRNINQFSAVKKKDAVELAWSVSNEKSTNFYQIELSNDGRKFWRTGKEIRANSSDGTSAKYQYQYHTDQISADKLYFRIRQVSGNIVRYSPVRMVASSNEKTLSVHPNPAVRTLNLKFNGPVTGNYRINIAAPSGQVLYTQHLKLENRDVLQLAFSNPIPAGVYFLHARNMSTGDQFSSKVVFGN